MENRLKPVVVALPSSLDSSDPGTGESCSLKIRERSCHSMSKAYSELVYHFVWATRNRQPLITPEVEALLVPYVEEKCRHLSYQLHAVRCIEDHVHLLLTLKPTDKVADAVKRLKGSSSRFINSQSGLGEVLYWQRGYGALSLRKKDIPVVTEHIIRQKEHHGVVGRVISKLERVAPPEHGS